MWSSAAVAHLLQGLTWCAFRDGILHTLVVSSGYLSYWCLSIVSNHFYVVNCWPSGKYVHLLYMYSILGRGSFCFSYCLNSAWHGGDQFVALLMWYGSPGFFDSGLQLSWICWSLVSHFPLDRFSMGFRSGEFAGQSSTPTPWSFNQLLGLLAVWAGAKSCCKIKVVYLKAGQQKEAWCAPKCIGKWVQRRWFSKNTMDQHLQMTLHPKSSQTVET